jgi:hypothetical protein
MVGTQIKEVIMREISTKDEIKAYAKTVTIGLVVFVLGFGGYILIFGRV